MPEQSYWREAIGALVGLLSLLFGWIWKSTNARIDGKASLASVEALQMTVNKGVSSQLFEQHTESDERFFQMLSEEQKIQRSHIGKLFDVVTEEKEKNRDRHDAVMDAIHSIKNSS